MGYVGQGEEARVQEDIRELLFILVHVFTARPDPEGNQTRVRERLQRFIDERMVDPDEERRQDRGGAGTEN